MRAVNRYFPLVFTFSGSSTPSVLVLVAEKSSLEAGTLASEDLFCSVCREGAQVSGALSVGITTPS